MSNIIFESLPTGKSHVSFSEVKSWSECSYRHYLAQIKKIDLSKPSPVLEFGTAVHLALENFLKTKVLNVELATMALENAWKKHENVENFTQEALKKAKEDSIAILLEFPSFFENNFPNWELVDAEHQLYEQIDGHPYAFKGFIDGIIKATGKRGETIYWILDHKTTQRGWFRDKRSDEMTKAQLALYKNFWCKKNPNISPKNVRCAFILLKKSAKVGEHCELFSVSLGEVPIKRSLKVVNNMIFSVKKGTALKNRESCLYCDYKNTEYCT